MPGPSPVANDSAQPIDLNFVGQSPHVFAYRVWFREPGDETWTRIGDGDTEDDEPDHHSTGPHPDGTRIAAVTIVGGNPGSQCRFLLTLSQGGRIVHGGAITERGRLSDEGSAVKKTEVILI